MKKVTVKIPIPFKPFLEKADRLIAEHGYENEDRVKVAMHQSVIFQEEAFNAALNLIEHCPGYTVSVEPMELKEGHELVIYHATYTLPTPRDLMQDNTIIKPEEFIQFLKDKLKPEDYIIE